ncbi:hypothetical protein I5Q34_20700 [Streptomyces sp. AV19]|uniref:hypothetical protein n=1 Tax=Streptomyces sp. AV19 TaxID=2793068 RepID=UPI0018FECB2A|nr:hypothetical protein [Streptomyces sp. AV19]MBH1936666.1 hypothetical protein [Streptomyces sp. AV19]MDG4532722.1 hypothetical protein [Streptomyces sp. AV19]
MTGMKKNALAAALGTALLLSLTACGDGEKQDTRDPQTVLTAAAKKTADQNSYRTKRKLTGPGGTERGEYAFTRRPDLDERRTWRADSKGEDDFDHTIGVGQMLYTKRSADEMRSYGRGRHWSSTNLLREGEAPPKPEDVQKRAEGDLPVLLGVLRATKDVQRVGDEDVSGKKAAHFKGTVVLDELAKYKGKAMRDWLRESYVKDHRKAGHDRVEIDVWIGKDDLPLKSRESAKGSKGGTELTEEYRDFGVEPGLRAPAAKDVLTDEQMKREIFEKAMKD